MLVRVCGSWLLLHNFYVDEILTTILSVVRGLVKLGFAGKDIVVGIENFRNLRINAITLGYRGTMRAGFHDESVGKLRFRAIVRQRDIVIRDHCPAQVG